MPRQAEIVRSCVATLVVGALLAAGGVGSSATGSPRRGTAPTARDLGTLGGATSRAVAVNDHGIVTGTAQTASGAEHAFVWDRRTGMRDLGTLGGATSRAVAVNHHGTVTGTAQTASGAQHAFVWNQRIGMRDLGTLGGTRSTAAAVNDRGAVVGSATNARGQSRAFLWNARRGMRDVGGSLSPAPVATSAAVDIDDRSHVLGEYLTKDYYPRAFFALRGHAPRDIGDLGGRYVTVPVDLNEHGQAVGFSWRTNGEPYQAFLWNVRTGVMTALGLGVHPSQSCVFSQPVAISDHGVVVGARVDNDGANFCSGVIWDTRHRLVTDVPFDPTDVNQRGLVVGSSPTTWGDVAGTGPTVPLDHAFCRSSSTGRTTDLGPGSAAAVNRAGDVVGAVPAGDEAQHAALWRCRAGR